ncbi:HTH-type transcriptional regulator CysL [Anaerotignum neopropionicum]|uniref:HTH-type transcriptional regulator CysL n=1 Tax=Anaerotignum neopropionicum TaxID=36847 RepID=A0A136WC64_9FIRM|nr:LysR family transcriptional regulator [Anaerotignum neopropionicum]KXL52090.1 HTH-type transcriptional regulator CysL [Anaerotignum neopropionicum]
MTLRHFKIFIEVCETMNMTQAAEKLYISQSAVSQAISDLEVYYGTKLFERLSKRIYLTSVGAKLLSYARHITEMTVEAETSIKALSESEFIRIGASVTVGAAILPNLVRALKIISPSTEIAVVEDNTAVIESLILSNKVDLGLVEGEIISPDIKIRPFLKDELILISGKDHPFSKKTIVSPQTLENQNFIIREVGSGTRSLFEIKMAASNINWKASWICNNSETIKNAVENNLGISVISEKAVTKELQCQTLFASKIEGIEFIRYFKIAHHKNKFITEKMNVLINHLVKYF